MRGSTWVLVEEFRRATDAELHCWSLQELKDKTERNLCRMRIFVCESERFSRTDFCYSNGVLNDGRCFHG